MLIYTSYFAGAAGGVDQGFPAKAIFYQVFNFSIFFIALIFLLRKPAKEFFKSRKEDFFRFEKQARQQEEKMKKEHQLWLDKVEEISKKETDIKSQALKEGENFKKQKQLELEGLKEKMKKDEEFLLKLEKQKLLQQTLSAFKEKVAGYAQKVLEKTCSEGTVRKNLYNKFSKEVEGLKI